MPYLNWLTNVAIILLAGLKLTDLLYWENGPFFVFFKLRTLIGIIENEDGRFTNKTNVVAHLFMCPYCLVGWIVMFTLALSLLDNSVVDFVLLWLAIWEIANYFIPRKVTRWESQY